MNTTSATIPKKARAAIPPPIPALAPVERPAAAAFVGGEIGKLCTVEVDVELDVEGTIVVELLVAVPAGVDVEKLVVAAAKLYPSIGTAIISKGLAKVVVADV